MYEKRPVSDIQNKILNGISDIYEKAKGYFLWEITKGVAMALKDTSDRVAEDALKLDIYNLTGDELENYTYRNEGISRKPAACAVGFVRVKGKGTVNAGDLFETDGLIGFTADEACDVFFHYGEDPVPDGLRVEVSDAAPADGVPVGKTVLGRHAVSHMPFA